MYITPLSFSKEFLVLNYILACTNKVVMKEVKGSTGRCDCAGKNTGQVPAPPLWRSRSLLPPAAVRPRSFPPSRRQSVFRSALPRANESSISNSPNPNSPPQPLQEIHNATFRLTPKTQQPSTRRAMPMRRRPAAQREATKTTRTETAWPCGGGGGGGGGFGPAGRRRCCWWRR
jgi:hypothetical protein